MIIILDSNLNIVYANPKLLTSIRQLLGLKVEVGGNLSNYIKNEVFKLLYYPVKALADNKSYQQLPLQVPILNGKYICSIEPVPDVAGKIEQVIIAFTYTDLENTLRENFLFNQYMKRASTARSIYNKLLEIFTHDLNGAMNSIKLMSSDEFESEEHLDFIPRIHQLTLYCNAINYGAAQLMKYNPNAAGIEQINLLKFINNISEKHNEYDKISIEIVVDPTHDIYAIKPFVRCIFEKIIDNATQYRSPDRTQKIMVSSKETEQWLIIAVRDNGMGIDLNDYGHLLNKPFRKIQDNKIYGTGLYLVHAIMEVIEGKVQIESNKEKGTTVSLYFPREVWF